MSGPDKPEPGSHCSACGVAYAPGMAWPRRCAVCKTVAYCNPLPVAVLVQPVRAGGNEGPRVGVLVIRRTVEPRAGWLALPGGFIECGETWQEACAREAYEEAGIHVEAARIRVLHVASTPRNLAVFGEGAILDSAELAPFAPNAEASERQILFAAIELAFPLHSQLLAATLRLYNPTAQENPHAAA